MFKKIFLTLAVIGLMTPVFVFALDPNDPYGIKGAAENTQLIQTTQTIPEIIGSIIGAALSFVGIVFFILILYAGFLWMTAFGNEEKVTTSKGIMEHAAIGLIIVLSAYAISKFVFGSLSEQVPAQPQNNAEGQICGTNMVYDFTGACISKCSYQFPVGTGCVDSTISGCSEPFKVGFCSGTADIKCCAGVSKTAAFCNSLDQDHCALETACEWGVVAHNCNPKNL